MVVVQKTTKIYSSTMYQNKEGHITFVQALHNKYIDQEVLDNHLILPKDRIISTDITFVGFGKVSSVQKQLKTLVSIDLSGQNITSAGDTHLLDDNLNRVRILNLSQNNLSWNEIIKIIPCLPSLRELILSGNQLTANEQSIEFPEKAFQEITMLTLGQIKLDWTLLNRILPRIWRGIEQIDLWDSKLAAEDLTLRSHSNDDFIRRFKKLGISHNYLSDLVLSDIGVSDNIVELDLSSCQLNRLEFGNSLDCWRNLTLLNVSRNNIEDWSSIARLNLLPRLKHLICFDNPFYNNVELAKNFTIARIKNLEILNRELISMNTRRDSEILYVRKLFADYKEYKSGRNASFAYCNPRYEELAEIYGLPEDMDTKVQDKYITVTLCYGEKSLKKKLPRDMSVSILQVLCRRLFKLGPSTRIEIECCGLDPSNNYTLDSKEQTLHFYSVDDGQRLVCKVFD